MQNRVWASWFCGIFHYLEATKTTESCHIQFSGWKCKNYSKYNTSWWQIQLLTKTQCLKLGIVIHEANDVIRVYVHAGAYLFWSKYAHSCICFMAAFASVHDQFKIRFHHFANDLISNKSTGRECVIQLSVAFTGIVHVHFSAQTLKWFYHLIQSVEQNVFLFY